MKLMEIQKRQMEEIQNKASGLFHTLFTKPQDFGKQLGSTVKEAVLKPITEGLGDLGAKAIQPLVSGIGGIFSGIFGGGKQDPMKVATDVNTAVTAQNSVAIASLTALMAAVMGMGAPAIAAPSGVPGGISLPAISIPAPTGGVSGDVGAGAPISVPVAPGAAGAPSAGATPADILNLPAMHAGASMNPLGMILGANQRGRTFRHLQHVHEGRLLEDAVQSEGNRLEPAVLGCLGRRVWRWRPSHSEVARRRCGRHDAGDERPVRLEPRHLGRDCTEHCWRRAHW